MTDLDWLTVWRGDAPLLVSFPHTGIDLPPELESRLVSPWLARKDADWWIDRLYDFAADLGATTVRTSVSRTVIDVNRDPSGVSLYPGQATTELCPSTTFDGEPLYREGLGLGDGEVEERRARWFDPYHTALNDEVARLGDNNRCVVVYDCHSIRSVIPRLFEGRLPVFNIGTNGGTTCSQVLSGSIAELCREAGRSSVVDGRFRGGYITRRLGSPQTSVHAVQMELGCRGYMREPAGEVLASNWPTPYDAFYAAAIREALIRILVRCISFARQV